MEKLTPSLIPRAKKRSFRSLSLSLIYTRLYLDYIRLYTKYLNVHTARMHWFQKYTIRVARVLKKYFAKNRTREFTWKFSVHFSLVSMNKVFVIWRVKKIISNGFVFNGICCY